MDRRERDIAVATHSLFLLAVFHGVWETDADVVSGRRELQIFRPGGSLAESVATTDVSREWCTFRPKSPLLGLVLITWHRR